MTSNRISLYILQSSMYDSSLKRSYLSLENFFRQTVHFFLFEQVHQNRPTRNPEMKNNIKQQQQQQKPTIRNKRNANTPPPPKYFILYVHRPWPDRVQAKRGLVNTPMYRCIERSTELSFLP